MLFGYIRDSRDWVPIGFLCLAILSGIGALIALWPPKKDDGMIKRHKLNQAKGEAVVCLILIIAAVFFGLANEIRHDYLDTYDLACAYEDQGDYESAYNTFSDLKRLTDVYKDVDERLEYLYPLVQYEYGLRAMESADYYHAFNFFSNAGEYRDAPDLADRCYFEYLKNIHPDWVA